VSGLDGYAVCSCDDPMCCDGYRPGVVYRHDPVSAFTYGPFMGPLRTAPERLDGHGGCEVLSPRHDPRRTSKRTYNWNRWWIAMDRRHKRVGARRRLLAAMGYDPRVIEVPSWRT
jgi:hypothetical protein